MLNNSDYRESHNLLHEPPLCTVLDAGANGISEPVSIEIPGIEEVENNGRPHQDAMGSRRYNLQGLPVTDDYRGIVIERGKARISR